MYTFQLEPDEIKKADKFEKKHFKSCWKKGMGAIGGGFEFVFVPTSIGTLSLIRCAKCKKDLQLTDFSTW
jgi:hypothetical protein